MKKDFFQRLRTIASRFLPALRKRIHHTLSNVHESWARARDRNRLSDVRRRIRTDRHGFVQMLVRNRWMRKVTAMVTRRAIAVHLTRAGNFHFTKKNFGATVKKEQIALKRNDVSEIKTLDFFYVVTPNSRTFDLIEFRQFINVQNAFHYHLFGHRVERAERRWAMTTEQIVNDDRTVQFVVQT